MNSLTTVQLTNVLARVLQINEANGRAAFTLQEAGMKYAHWWSNNTVNDVLTWNTKKWSQTGRSGFSVGPIQIDLGAGNQQSIAVNEAIKVEAVNRGLLSEAGADALFDALQGFHAINLAGYASATGYRDGKGQYDPMVEAQAQQRFSTVVADREIVNDLLSNDPVVKSVVLDQTADALHQVLDRASAATERVIGSLAAIGRHSALLTANGDQMLIVLADICNQKGNCNAAVRWLTANPDATWAQFVAWDSRPNGSARDAAAAHIFSQLASGAISPDTNPYSTGLTGSIAASGAAGIERPGPTGSLALCGLLASVRQARVTSTDSPLTDAAHAALEFGGVQEYLAINPYFASSLVTPTIGISDNSVSLSIGDPISATVTFSGSSMTFDDGQGLQGSANLDKLGQITGDSWTAGNGRKGLDNFNPDGSSSGTITYSGGGYADYIDDGAGNLTIDYYTKNGNLIRGTWLHSDGSSGTSAKIDNGLTIVTDAAFAGSPPSAYEEQTSPDGSFRIDTTDAGDHWITTSADGVGHTTSTAGQGPGSNFDTANETLRKTFNFSFGHSIDQYFDSTGKIIRDTWTAADGSHGSDTFNPSGAVRGKTFNADGSADSYSVFGTPDGPYSILTLSSGNPAFVAGPWDLTRDHYGSNGSLVSDQWQLVDGVIGSDAFNSDGSGSGTATRLDGTASFVSVDASGRITVDNYDADGGKTSEDWWQSDGTRGVTEYGGSGTKTLYTYSVNGTVLIDQYDGVGDKAAEQTALAGAIFSPDGSDFGKIVNSDGSFTISYSDSDGDVMLLQYGAEGQLTGTDHVSESRSPGSGFSGTWSGGETWSSPYNNDTPVKTEANGTQVIMYVNASGHQTGADWTATDGSHGTHTYNLDGSSESATYLADGTYSIDSDDGQGGIADQFYDASDWETGDAWRDADGSHGWDTFNPDGSSQGGTYAADGSFNAYYDDGQGNTFESNFAADGAMTSDNWQKSDGSSGDDSSNTDGSKSGNVYDCDGSYSTYDIDAVGNNLTTYFSPIHVRIGDAWTRPDGSSGSDTFDADSSSLGRAQEADGSTSNYSDDGHGNRVAYAYSPTGTLTRQTWTHSDGTAGVSVFNADGSSSGNTDNPNGTTTSCVRDAQGNSVTDFRSAAGLVTAELWKHSDGSYGAINYDTSGTEVAATTVTADGTRMAMTDERQGNVSTTQYDIGGNKTSKVWQNADGSHGSDDLLNGSWVSLNYDVDGSYTRTIQDAAGDSTTQYFGSSGALQGSNWSKLDGTHGTSTTSTDGSAVDIAYNRDGSYSRTSTDRFRNTATKYYSSTGQLLRETWVRADGSSGQDTSAHAGADSAANFQKDGVYAIASHNGAGATTVNVYQANGTLLYTIGETRSGDEYSSDEADLGSAGAASITNIQTLQQTYTAAGCTEIQRAALRWGNGTISADESLAGGPDLSQAWSNTSLNGEPVGYETSALPQFGYLEQHNTLRNANLQLVRVSPETPGFGGVAGSFLGVWPSGGGYTILTTTPGAGYWYDGSNGIIDANTDAAAQTYKAAHTLNSAIAAAQSASLAGDTVYTNQFSGGGITQDFEPAPWRYYGGIAPTYVIWSDGKGDEGTGSSMFNPVTRRGTEIDIGRNSAGNVSQYTLTPDVWTARYYYASGALAVTDQLFLAFGLQAQSINIQDPSGNMFSSNLANPSFSDESSSATQVYQTRSLDRLGDSIASNYQYTYDNVLGCYSRESVVSTWVTRDGAKIQVSLDLSNGKGTERIDYLDGTTTIVVNDSGGGYVARNYDESGTLTSDTWQADDGTHGSDTYASDGSGREATMNVDGTKSTTTRNEVGDVTTQTFDATGTLVSQSWQRTDGTYGSDAYASDGSSSGLKYLADGSHSSYSDDGRGKVTTRVFSPGGVLTGDTWAAADGSHGSDNFGADGSSKGSFTDAAGNHHGYVNDGKGTVTTQAFDSSYRLLGDTWSNSDGSSGSESVAPDGSISSTFVNANGSHGSSSDDGHGDNTYERDDPSGGVYRSWSKTDGSHGYGYTDAQGNLSEFDYDAGGDLTQVRHDAAGVGDSETHNVDGSSSTVFVNADGSHGRSSDDGHGNKAYERDDQNGGVYRSRSASDGSHGYSYTDARGNLNAFAYDPVGDLTHTECDAAGVGSSETHNLDGSSFGTFVNADGSKGCSSDDGRGNRIYERDDLNGGVYRSWAKGDGTHGYGYSDATGSLTEFYYDPAGNMTLTQRGLASDGVTQTSVQTSGGSQTINVGPGRTMLTNVGASDTVAFGADVLPDHLWFSQSGSDLVVSVLGTYERLTVSGWFTAASPNVSEFIAGDNLVLQGTAVANLVNAMATFAVPAATQMQYTPQESNALQPQLAANWH